MHWTCIGATLTTPASELSWELGLLAEKTSPGRIWQMVYGRDRSIGFGLEFIGKLTPRFPWLLGVVVLAFTALCVVQLPRMSVDGDLMRVFKDSGA